MIIAGNRIYETCAVCGKLVQLNKWIFSDLHLCLSREESEKKFLNQLMPESQAERNKKNLREGGKPIIEPILVKEEGLRDELGISKKRG